MRNAASMVSHIADIYHQLAVNHNSEVVRSTHARKISVASFVLLSTGRDPPALDPFVFEVDR